MRIQAILPGWFVLIALVIALPTASLRAEPLELEDCDKIVFLGDSITQQALFTQYLENYFFLRFPDKTIDFRNAGIGGDRTVNVFGRFERDVAAHQPTHVLIMLGMNDAGYRSFSRARYNLYTSDMESIIEQVEAIGAEPVLLSPTYFDWPLAKVAAEENGTPYKAEAAGYNDVLKQYGDWLKSTAETRGLHFVDTFSPMAAVVSERRVSDPSFTLSSDGVHPEPIGHVLITLSVLDQLSLEASLVSSLEISSDSAEDTVGGEVTDFEASEIKVSFSHLAKSLPMVFPNDARRAAAALGVTDSFGIEKLLVRDLAADSDWFLSIDDNPIGRFSAESLAEGIELHDDPATPQYAQSMTVLNRIQQRLFKQIDLRNWWVQKKMKDYALYADGPPTLAALNEHAAWLEDFDAANEVLNLMMDDLRVSIEERAQPKPRRYLLQRN